MFPPTYSDAWEKDENLSLNFTIPPLIIYMLKQGNPIGCNKLIKVVYSWSLVEMVAVRWRRRHIILQ